MEVCNLTPLNFTSFYKINSGKINFILTSTYDIYHSAIIFLTGFVLGRSVTPFLRRRVDHAERRNSSPNVKQLINSSLCSIEIVDSHHCFLHRYSTIVVQGPCSGSVASVFFFSNEKNLPN